MEQRGSLNIASTLLRASNRIPTELDGCAEPVQVHAIRHEGGRARHLMPAEDVNPELIRGLLATLAPARAIATAPGIVAIKRSDVVETGLDTLAVARWLQPRGGYGAMAYLRPTRHRLSADPCRPALHPVAYFAVPAAALAPAEQQERRAIA